jgi:lipoprotein-anchoring transpeptidase ErfK/SrfK
MAYSIRISLSNKRLSLFQDGRLAKNYPIGIGKTITPTPTGVFTIINKRPNPGGPFGVMWLGLSAYHYGIHGTNNPSSIGSYVSHGCIRMHNHDVLELASRVPVGTTVIITHD